MASQPKEKLSQVPQKKKPGPAKGTPSNNPNGRPRGARSRVWTKDGHAELMRRGFNPVAEMVKLYGVISEEVSKERYASHVWHSSMRATQRAILDSLLPYSVHKVEVTREKEIDALKRPPVIIQLPESASGLEKLAKAGSDEKVSEKKD